MPDLVRAFGHDVLGVGLAQAPAASRNLAHELASAPASIAPVDENAHRRIVCRIRAWASLCLELNPPTFRH